MGLEAGWNCHISLLGEHNSELDGAPSATELHTYEGSVHASSRMSTESVNKHGKHHSGSKMHETPDPVKVRRSSAPGSLGLELVQVSFHLHNTRHSPRKTPEKSTDHYAKLKQNHSVEEPSTSSVVMVSEKSPMISVSDTTPSARAVKIANQEGDVSLPLLMSRTSPADIAPHSRVSESSGRESSPSDQATRPHLSSISSNESYLGSSYISENTDSVGLSNRVIQSFSQCII